MKEKTCLALFSGGLDSMLSVKLMQNMGFNVVILNFNTGFFFGAYEKNGDTYVYRAKTPPGYDIHVIDISAEFFEMIKNPKHGFGKHMNPCIDCKIFMLRKARELMPQFDAGFVITGEVLGQRPMTQNARSLRVIEEESGLKGYLLRPLCAKNMPATEPERLGWVDRGKLLNLQGRGRTRQLEFAGLWGLQDYVKTPAGGCILTEESFSKRLKDYLITNPKSHITNEDMSLLTIGRQFRKDGVKFIVGRNEKENEILLKHKDKGTVFDAQGVPGPTVITFDNTNNEMKEFIAGVTAGYSDGKTSKNVEVAVAGADGKREIKTVEPVKAGSLDKYRIDL
jgi:tRNA-specific 2-thiouridylase